MSRLYPAAHGRVPVPSPGTGSAEVTQPSWGQPAGPPSGGPPGRSGGQPSGWDEADRPPSWVGDPGPTRRDRGRLPVIALVVVLGLLACGGLGTTAWLLTREDTAGEQAGGSLPTPSATVARSNPANPGPTSSTDARFVAEGQCVRNEGTTEEPEMTISGCTNGAYEVLARIDGRTTGEADAQSKCAKVAGYTKWYFYDSGLDSLDFVLCLKDH